MVAVRPGSDLEADDVTSWARERLSAYKIPRVVQFIDALPKFDRKDPQAIDRPNRTPRPEAELKTQVNPGEISPGFTCPCAQSALPMRSECVEVLDLRGACEEGRHRLSCGLEMLGRSMGLDRSTVLIQLHELVGIRIRLRADQLIQNRSGLFRAHLLASSATTASNCSPLPSLTVISAMTAIIHSSKSVPAEFECYREPTVSLHGQ